MFTDEKVAEHKRDVEQIKQRLIKESTIESDIGKESLAETAAMLIIHQRVLFEQMVNGTAKAEVARTFPGIGSNIRRVLGDLGVTVAADESQYFLAFNDDDEETEDDSNDDDDDDLGPLEEATWEPPNDGGGSSMRA